MKMKWKNMLLAASTLGVVAGTAIRRRRELDLRGQVVLVTGSSRGLGFLIAKAFAHEGCRVAICARNEEELEQARAQLESHGADVIAVKCDISDRDQVSAMVDTVTRHFGRIDILVNNAGIMVVGPVQTMNTEDFQQAMDVMYWGMFYTTMAVLPQMIQRRAGRIVNITSVGGKVSVPRLLPYTAAKFAAVGFSEGLRAEMKKHGIYVITVVPGLMRTGSHLGAYFKGKHKAEFTWFSLGASMPVVAMDAEVAARQIVEATRRGTSEKILSWPAHLIVRIHGLIPGITTDMLGVINRLIPEDPNSKEKIKGEEILKMMGNSPIAKIISSLAQNTAQGSKRTP
mgnify:CR=1 FL=1